MKILSVTLYNISNYGAMLQAWALRRVLERMGHEVENLFYQKEYPGRYSWKGFLRSKSLASIRYKIEVNRQMDIVEKEIGGWKQTRPYWSVEAIRRNPPQADCYLVGSDQMLRPERMTSLKAAIPSLLAFGADDVKRVGYAMSFGRPSLTDEEYKNYSWAVPYLQRFSAMSVRESTGVPIMGRLAGVDAQWVPDPTLLLNKSDYVFQFGIPDTERQNIHSYMLSYCDSHARTHLFDECINTAKKILGGEHIELIGRRALNFWLTGIANSKCVITNSFHGTIFSINFNTPFISLGFDGELAWRNDRAQNILQKFGLEDRFIMPGEESRIADIIRQPIDWDRVNRLHAEFSKIGQDFLGKNL